MQRGRPQRPATRACTVSVFCSAPPGASARALVANAGRERACGVAAVEDANVVEVAVVESVEVSASGNGFSENRTGGSRRARAKPWSISALIPVPPAAMPSAAVPPVTAGRLRDAGRARTATARAAPTSLVARGVGPGAIAVAEVEARTAPLPAPRGSARPSLEKGALLEDGCERLTASPAAASLGGGGDAQGTPTAQRKPPAGSMNALLPL